MASTDERDRPFFDEDDDDDFADDEEFADDSCFGGGGGGGECGALDPNTPSSSVVVAPEKGANQPAPGAFIPIHERRLAPLDDSRRLFKRLWTDEDEIVILEGYLEFVTRRGTTHNNYQHDTGPFYEQIKSKIQLDFNKNQLIEKIRRLKKKYRTVDNRMKAMGDAFAFKSAHEKATYEISRQIWSSTFNRPRNRRYNQERSNLEAGNNGVHVDEVRATQPEGMVVEDANLGMKEQQPCPVSVSSVIEETMKCCLSPLLKELLQYGVNVPNGGLPLNSLPLPLSLLNVLGELPKGVDGERWKEQQILELEVFLKRLELLEEEIKAKLEELRSSSSSTATTEAEPMKMEAQGGLLI